MRHCCHCCVKVDLLFFKINLLQLMKTLIIAKIIIFSFTIIIFAQTTNTNVVKQMPEELEKYLEKQKMIQKLKPVKPEPESAARRAEIIFFSSIPLIYSSSYLLVKLFMELTTGESSEFPDSYWYYIGINTVGIATYLTIKDYKLTKKKKIKAPIFKKEF